MTYAYIGFVAVGAMCALVILYTIIMAVRWVFADYTSVCKVYLREDNRIQCVKDNMIQEIGICKHCMHYKGYHDIDPKYVLCNWERG